MFSAALVGVTSMIVLGYALGAQPFVRQYFDKVSSRLFFISVLPIGIEDLSSRKELSLQPRAIPADLFQGTP